jgi:CBS domain containing-hemolysin-like protein
LTLAGSQKDFPVGYHNRLTSILHHSDLIKGLQEKGENARISELPLQDILTADINEPLNALVERMQGNRARMIGIMDQGHVVGLLNLENILEFIKIHDAVDKHKLQAGRSH